MKLKVLTGVLAVTALISVACGGREAAAPKAQFEWANSLESAQAQAAQEGKLVMIEFYATWCGWCKRLESQTFADERVVRALAGVVPVRLDAEREGLALANRMRVGGIPATVFLSPKGQEVGRISGYLDAEPFLEELAKIMARQ